MNPISSPPLFSRSPNLGNEIANEAMRWVGQKEYGKNDGFLDANFEARLRRAGWRPGQSWCAYFVRSCLEEVFRNDPAALVPVHRVVGGGAVAIWQTAQKEPDGGFWECLQKPRIGSIAVWQTVGSWTGHTGIVCAVPNQTQFDTIEGNTTGKESRNGDRVAIHRHRNEEFFRVSGLKLLGFVAVR